MNFVTVAGLLLLVVSTVHGLCPDETGCHVERKMESPGTYTIAALFAGGRRNSTALNSECTLMLNTPQYNRHAIEQAEALITAIEFVNERQLLPPNVTLGYEIWDTCSQYPKTNARLEECTISEYKENLITNNKPLVTIWGPSYNTRDLERKHLERDTENALLGLTDAEEAKNKGDYRGIFFLTDQPPLSQNEVPESNELLLVQDEAANLEPRCQVQALAAVQYAIRIQNSSDINVISSGDICGKVFLEEFVSKAENDSFKCYQNHNPLASSAYGMDQSQCTVFDLSTQKYILRAEKDDLCKGFTILIANTEFVHEFLEFYLSDTGLDCEKMEYTFLIGQLWGDPSYYPSIEKSIVKLIEKGVEVRGLQYHVGSSECIQNHMTSLRANSAELERNCWLRDYWEQQFECSIQRGTCKLTDSLNRWSSILSRNYKAGLIMDSVMMLVEYIKAWNPSATNFQYFSTVIDNPASHDRDTLYTYNNQTETLVHTLSNTESCKGATFAFLQPKNWQFDIFNFSTLTNQLQSNQIGYLYYDCGNEDSQWRYENNSEASQSETVSCSFATPVVSRSDMCLCDATTAPSCRQDTSLVVLPLLIATAAAVLFMFYVYQKRRASLVSISLHDLPIVLSTDALFSVIIAILSSVGVLEPLDCDDYILDSLIQIGNSICFSWLFISLLTSMMTSRLATVCLKGPGFCVLLGIQIALSIASYTASGSISLQGFCIEDRQSALSVLAYWYSALVLLAFLLLFLVHTAREHRKTWNREHLAVLFVGGCLIGYCVLLSTLLWQDTCVGLTVSVVMLASTPAIALIIAVSLMLAKMNQAAISDDKGPLDRAVSLLLQERDSFSGELPTGLEIALEDDLKDKIDKAFIDPTQIRSQHRIGRGNFGFVFKGQWNDELVAIKTVQDFDSDSAVNAFIKEAIIMTTFKHPNVMNMLGISKLSFGSFLPPSPVILLPYMELGDLKTFLRKSRARSSRSTSTSGSGESNTAAFPAKPLELVDLLNFGRQIAKGMAYLGAKKVIHRDLAARNCMIDYNMRVRVSDFGLAREAEYYRDPRREARLPYRWMSVEAIKDYLFTKESDVWAFGVTLWEIMTKAEVPYSAMSVKEMVNDLMKGYRLERPYDCQRSVYDIMLRCWKQKPHERPTFSELIDLLDKEIEIFGPEYKLFDDEGSAEGGSDEVFGPELQV